MIDFLACESQFLDHAAPVWHATDPAIRGRFLVERSLVDRAAAAGIDAQAVDAEALRFSSTPPGPSRGEGPRAFVVSVGDTKIGRRLGYRRFAFMEHGAGQAYMGDQHGARHPSYAGGRERDDTDVFLVPNEYSAALWRAAYPQATVEVIGCPKLDTLPHRQLDPIAPGHTVAISFHWPAFVAPEAGTALGHYLPVLPSLAKRFHVIGHAHPKGDWPAQMQREYRRAGIEFVSDFADVSRRADVYVCDNSSTIFEFASTGRPVVVLNAPEFRRNVQHGLRFWEAAHVGINVDHPGDLGDAVATALEDEPEIRRAREDALSLVYAHRTGAAQRAADALAAWTQQLVAA